jgi:hypothetical protein
MKGSQAQFPFAEFMSDIARDDKASNPDHMIDVILQLPEGTVFYGISTYLQDILQCFPLHITSLSS